MVAAANARLVMRVSGLRRGGVVVRPDQKQCRVRGRRVRVVVGRDWD